MVYNLRGSWKNVNFLKGSDLIKLLGARLAQWLLKFIQILSSLIFWEYLKLFKVLKIALVYVLNFGWSSSPNLARYWSSSRRYHQRDLSEPLGSVLHPFCAKIPSKLTTKEPSPGRTPTVRAPFSAHDSLRPAKTLSWAGTNIVPTVAIIRAVIAMKYFFFIKRTALRRRPRAVTSKPFRHAVLWNNAIQNREKQKKNHWNLLRMECGVVAGAAAWSRYWFDWICS